jgi:hypothetical protein
VREPSPVSIRGGAEATYEPVLRQREANGLRNLETNRAEFQDDAGVDAHHPLYPVRLRVVESNNVTNPYVMGSDVF